VHGLAARDTANSFTPEGWQCDRGPVVHGFAARGTGNSFTTEARPTAGARRGPAVT